MFDFKSLDADTLLRYQAEIHQTLRNEKRVVRSENSITCDLADYLFEKALNLKLCSKSNKGFTAIDPRTNEKYKIKGRRPINGNKSRQLSNIRELETGSFDKLAALIFDENYYVQKAVVIPANIVIDGSIPNVRTNSSFFRLEDAVIRATEVADVTDLLIEERSRLQMF